MKPTPITRQERAEAKRALAAAEAKAAEAVAERNGIRVALDAATEILNLSRHVLGNAQRASRRLALTGAQVKALRAVGEEDDDRITEGTRRVLLDLGLVERGPRYPSYVSGGVGRAHWYRLTPDGAALLARYDAVKP